MYNMMDKKTGTLILSALALSLVMVSAIVLAPAIAAKPIEEQVTGGGWILNECTGKKNTFGFNAQQLEDGTLKGEVEYIDHSLKLNIHGYDIYTLVINGNDAWIEGHCRVNGDDAPYHFRLHAIDNDEPGKYDYFSIQLLDWNGGYWDGAELGFPDDAGGGGNIQVHLPEY